MATLDKILGIGPAIRAGLAEIGVTNTQTLAATDVARLTQVGGISPARAEAFITAARELSADDADAPSERPKTAVPDKKIGKKKAAKATLEKAAGSANSSVKKSKANADKKKKKAGKGKTKGSKKSKK